MFPSFTVRDSAERTALVTLKIILFNFMEVKDDFVYEDREGYPQAVETEQSFAAGKEDCWGEMEKNVSPGGADVESSCGRAQGCGWLAGCRFPGPALPDGGLQISLSRPGVCNLFLERTGL